MGDIKITNDNYNEYQKLLSLKNGKILTNGIVGEVSIELFEVANFCLTFGTSILVAKRVFSDSYIYAQMILSTVLFIPTFCLLPLTVKKLINKLQLKKLRRKNTEIDINVDKEELVKALVKYEGLSAVENNIDKKKDEHLSNIEDNMKTLSTTDKIEYLQKELEFWKQVAVKEKYDIEEKEESNNKVYQK